VFWGSPGYLKPWRRLQGETGAGHTRPRAQTSDHRTHGSPVPDFGTVRTPSSSRAVGPRQKFLRWRWAISKPGEAKKGERKLAELVWGQGFTTFGPPKRPSGMPGGSAHQPPKTWGQENTKKLPVFCLNQKTIPRTSARGSGSKFLHIYRSDGDSTQNIQAVFRLLSGWRDPSVLEQNVGKKGKKRSIVPRKMSSGIPAQLPKKTVVRAGTIFEGCRKENSLHP